MDIVITEGVAHCQGGDVEQVGPPDAGLGVLGPVHAGLQLHGAEGPGEGALVIVLEEAVVQILSCICVLYKEDGEAPVNPHGVAAGWVPWVAGGAGGVTIRTGRVIRVS